MTSYYTALSNGNSVAEKDLYQDSQTGDVPTAVHNLLTSTKQLQETLKLWSLKQATESDVSDVYMQIGHQFNTLIATFARHEIDLSDIHSVPAEMRVVLERCLGEEASPAVLDKYMPDLHKALFKLLKGLKGRQDEWHAATGR